MLFFSSSSGFTSGLLTAGGMAWLAGAGRGHWVSAFLRGMVGWIGWDELCLAASNVYVIFPVVHFVASHGPDGTVGVRGWGCSMGIDEMIQRSVVAVVTVCLCAHDVGWWDDGLNVAVSQRGVGGDCTLLHKL
jgi:hypothetical protein